MGEVTNLCLEGGEHRQELQGIPSNSALFCRPLCMHPGSQKKVSATNEDFMDLGLGIHQISGGNAEKRHNALRTRALSPSK
jgi:hypothetical protein